MTTDERARLQQVIEDAKKWLAELERNPLHATLLDIEQSVHERLVRRMLAVLSALSAEGPSQQEDSNKALRDHVALYGFRCPKCGHHHAGQTVAYICIGCPCDMVPDWVAAPRSAPATQQDEVAFVIERHFHSQLHYWTGKPPVMLGAWSSQHEDALRFARRVDAECMLTWHLGGIGNVVQHGWVAAPRSAPATAIGEMVTIPRSVFDGMMNALESDDIEQRRAAFEAAQDCFDEPAPATVEEQK